MSHRPAHEEFEHHDERGLLFVIINRLNYLLDKVEHMGSAQDRLNSDFTDIGNAIGTIANDVGAIKTALANGAAAGGISPADASALADKADGIAAAAKTAASAIDALVTPPATGTTATPPASGETQL